MDNQFKYQHSQILQFVYEAAKEGKIDQEEKIKIKGPSELNYLTINYLYLGLIFSNDPQIQIFYEHFEKTKNSKQFIKELKSLLCNLSEDEEENDSDEEELKVSDNVLNNVESSPNDYLMYMKKRRNQHGQKRKSDEECFAKQPEIFGTSVRACEEGMSPKINLREYDDSD